MPAAYELSVFFYPMNRIIFQPDGTRALGNLVDDDRCKESFLNTNRFKYKPQRR
jgi:hypothetical protein